MGGARARSAGPIGATVALGALGTTWLVSDFRLYQLALAGVLAIAMLGLNILTGFNGQISLGHGAFIGIGSYTAAILVRDVGVPHPVAIAMASVTCFVVGCLIGVPALRLPGSSLALVTLGFALALPQAIKKFDGLTGGAYGIYLPFDEQFNSPWTGLTNDQFRYLVVVLVGTLLFWVGWNIVRGRWGLAMMAVRDQSVAAASMGVDLARTKVTAFGVSAAYAGAAGGLQLAVVGSVNPDQLTLAVSFSLVTGIVVGGLGTVSGAVIGAVFVTFVPYIAPEISPAAPTIVNGVATVLVIIVAPGGIVGLLRAARGRVSERGRSSWTQGHPSGSSSGSPASRPPSASSTASARGLTDSLLAGQSTRGPTRRTLR